MDPDTWQRAVELARKAFEKSKSIIRDKYLILSLGIVTGPA
jgi:hypothetical protein